MLRRLLNLLRPRREPIREPRIYGRWRSDKHATLEYLRSVPQCTGKALEFFSTIVGNLTVMYTPDAVIYGQCEQSGTYPYRVVARDNRAVTIEVKLGVWSNRERWTLTFVEDGYWTDTPDPQLFWYREKFVRLDESTPAAG